MSITSSMYTGAAGMSSHSDAMGVISDNIANVNTVGYRSQRANFADVLGGFIAGSAAGAGSRIGSVQTMFMQGSLLGTGNNLDLAIEGNGFFVVNGAVGGVDGSYYTRSGQFHTDADGYLVNPDGLRVQGYGLDSTGAVGNTPGDMMITQDTLPPTATANVTVKANLDADQAIDPTAFDINDPGGTSDYSTGITAYDSLGTPHQLTLFFKKLADAPTQQWEVHVAAAGTDVTPAATSEYTELGNGTLDFDTAGALSASSLSSVNVSWAGAAAATINLDFGTPTGSGGTGVDGITGYAESSGASAITQDGSGSGELSDYQVLADGTVEGRYTNGQTRPLGQLATAVFASEDGLARRGNALFGATIESRDPVLGRPGSDGHGALMAGSLEGSNVDLAHEFVTMIAVQRGFQGNSRTITTADDMLTEVVSLKR
ncbi:MAG: flagellar hook protein FlgE [Nannocystaceae bacterium]|nr:flagellar hook protein FlgE [Nannocystaceae bacterium]